MKKIILIFTTIVVSSVCLFSQGIIALHHNGFTQIFKGTSAFSDAYNAAQNGDTMYLSGGYFWPVAINKRLVIFGAGHFPDSTAATGVTYIQGNLELNPDADSLYLEGLYINGNIQYSGGDLKIDYLIIRRCMIVGALVLNGNRTTPSLYNTIEQNVILNYVDLSNTKQLILRNNIFQDIVHHAYEALISNNIFLRSPHVPWIGGVPLFNVDNSIISNNVFYSVSPNYGNVVFHYCENNTIQNNLFITTPNYTSNIAMGNFHDVAQSSIFVNCTSDNFNYSFNYHLQSPTTYLGTDGTQVGIYGGSVPWKEGSVPKIPHIIEKNIAPQTDSNGMLQIQIKVAAQNE